MQSVSSLPIKTFTIGFDDPAYDESVYAEKVANQKTGPTAMWATSKKGG